MVVDVNKMKHAKNIASGVWLERFKSFHDDKNNRVRSAYIKTLPKLYRKLFLRCYTDETNKTQIIKAKCLDCCSFDKFEITNCTAITCPIHRIRPYQKKEK